MFVLLCNCSPDEADSLASTLVQEDIAACVNILPGVRSVYRWEGEICTDEETTLLIKVAKSKATALGDRIRELHSYDTVEILALPVDEAASDPRYLDWVRGSSFSSDG